MNKLLSGLVALAAALPAWAGVGAWTPLPGPPKTLIYKIDRSPSNLALRYAATQAGMYVSTNNGLTWTLSNSGIAPSPAGYMGVNDLAVDPLGGTLYITPWFLQKSVDNGAHWARTGWVTENPQALVLAVDPKSPTTVYAGANRGVYKTIDGGVSWKYMAGESSVYAIAVDPTQPSTVYRGVGAGIFKSNDGGLSWTQISTTLTSPKVIVVDPRNSSTVYVGTNGSGVYKSTDGGATFRAINVCISSRCSPTTLDHVWVTAIVVDPADSSRVYLGSGSGLYKSLDGGAHWQQANNGPYGVATMMIDPVNADTIVASDGSVMISYTFPRPSDFDRVFDWAEAAYHNYFSPPTTTQSISGYQARWYPGTQTYLGVLDGEVYVYGTVFGGLLRVGRVEDFLPAAIGAGY
jgi:hypothetical protein